MSRALLALVSALLLAEPNGSWATASRLNEARAEIAAAVLGDQVYVAGGFDSDGSDLFSVESYDPRFDSWTYQPSMPRGLNHLGLASLGGVLYVVGGNQRGTPTSGLWAFDRAANSWSRRADLPLRRSAAAVVAAAGRIFVFGGVGDRPGPTLSYDPSIDTWDLRAPIPTLREHVAAAVVDDRVYVVGGRWTNLGNLPTNEMYDPATDAWQMLPPMSTPRGGLTVAALRGQVHVLGGEACDPRRTFAQHEVFDPATNTWSGAPALPTPRHGLGSAVVDDQLYVVAGGTSAGLSTSQITEVFRLAQ